MPVVGILYLLYFLPLPHYHPVGKSAFLMLRLPGVSVSEENQENLRTKESLEALPPAQSLCSPCLRAVNLEAALRGVQQGECIACMW